MTNAANVPPYTHAETKSLRDEIADAEPTLGEVVDELLGPFTSGWVTVVCSTGSGAEPRNLILWYLCDPADAPARASTTDFHFDWNHGLSHFSQSWDNGTETVTYHPAGTGAEVPLVYLRSYQEGSPRTWETLELAEDFRLFWDLYDDHETDEYRRSKDGEIEVVARREGLTLKVRANYLWRYLAARQLAAVGQLFADRTVTFAGRDEHVVAGMHSLHVSDLTSQPEEPVVWLYAKRAILPDTVETCEVWPYEEDKPPAERFVVGYDDHGHAVELPAGGGSDFLRPVHFRREVLERYYADPDKYTVSDGVVHGPTWVLPVDNDHVGRVLVYIGDLGSLPGHEQKHWKAHSIDPEGTISETAFRRDFLAEFADPTSTVWRLHAAREKANEAFLARYGVPLYREPHDNDGYVQGTIHVPTNGSVAAFDDELTPLAKYTTDLLNEKGIADQFTSTPKDKNVKGIGKLEHLVAQDGMDDGGLCSALRDVYGTRTRSSAHGKSTNFDLEKLLNGVATLQERFTSMLESLAAGYETFAASLGSGDVAT